jgi:hypothetical protein
LGLFSLRRFGSTVQEDTAGKGKGGIEDIFRRIAASPHRRGSLSGPKGHLVPLLLFGDFVTHSQGLFYDIGGDRKSVDLSNRLLQFACVTPVNGIIENLVYER